MTKSEIEAAIDAASERLRVARNAQIALYGAADDAINALKKEIAERDTPELSRLSGEIWSAETEIAELKAKLALTDDTRYPPGTHVVLITAEHIPNNEDVMRYVIKPLSKFAGGFSRHSKIIAPCVRGVVDVCGPKSELPANKSYGLPQIGERFVREVKADGTASKNFHGNFRSAQILGPDPIGLLSEWCSRWQTSPGDCWIIAQDADGNFSLDAARAAVEAIPTFKMVKEPSEDEDHSFNVIEWRTPSDEAAERIAGRYAGE